MDLNSFMPYLQPAQEIVSGMTMPNIDYGQIQGMDDAQMIAEQAKQRSSSIGKGIGGGIGAALGSVLMPGIGTAIGGALGSKLGEAGGGLFGGNRQAATAERIAKDRESKLKSIIDARKERAMQHDLINQNTIFQSF